MNRYATYEAALFRYGEHEAACTFCALLAEQYETNTHTEPSRWCCGLACREGHDLYLAMLDAWSTYEAARDSSFAARGVALFR